MPRCTQGVNAWTGAHKQHQQPTQENPSAEQAVLFVLPLSAQMRTSCCVARRESSMNWRTSWPWLVWMRPSAYSAPPSAPMERPRQATAVRGREAKEERSNSHCHIPSSWDSNIRHPGCHCHCTPRTRVSRGRGAAGGGGQVGRHDGAALPHVAAVDHPQACKVIREAPEEGMREGRSCTVWWFLPTLPR